jgi:hypothetical protein
VIARPKHEADEQVQCSERAGAQPLGEENERSPPSTRQVPDGHGVDIRGFKGSVVEGERCGKRRCTSMDLHHISIDRFRKCRDEDFYIVVNAVIDSGNTISIELQKAVDQDR